MSMVIDGTNGLTFPDSSHQQTGIGYNRLINGAMMIDQRNAGAAQTIANGSYAYTIDRWRASSFGATCTGQQIFSTNRYLYQFTGAASVTNIDFNQRIESKNCLDLASQTVTLSVDLANSLLTSITWQVSYATATDNFTSVTGISSGTFTVNSTLTTYSIQVSLPANAINGLQINLTAGAQTSGTWKIGNVQLEKGSTATSFDYRPYGTELALCQRYYLATEITVSNILYSCQLRPDGYRLVRYHYPVEMRTAATATITWNGDGSGISYGSVLQTKQFFQCLSASAIATSTVVPYLTAFSASAEL